MLDILTNGFRQAKESLQGKATLSDENIADAVKMIQSSLLDADVEYGVAKNFVKRVKEEAAGSEVILKAGKGADRLRVTPADHFVQICQKELEALMGPIESDLKFASNKPTIIMMVGLQGTGKTTTTAKLAKFLTEQKKRKPLLVAADIYRPAAVEQLKVLGRKLNTPVFHVEDTSPVLICEKAVAHAFQVGCDTILFDTAGRLTVDAALMQELADIKSKTNPDNILLVVDAMMGQDAVTTAKSFDDMLGITGFVMTKLDGDARGGAALSIKEVTGKPIKFLGMGEDLARLEVFRPEGLASRILGMGDIVGLMGDFERVAEEDQEEKALKMLQGQFTFRDFYEQISMLQKMGPLKDVMAKLPMQNLIPKGADIDERELVKVKAMIDSMTEQERVKPALLNNSRITRIAKGSGRKDKEVVDLVEKFKGMRKMMGMMGKSMGGMLGKIPGMNQLNNLNHMRKMAKNMQAAGGGGMPDIAAMMGMGGGGAGMGGPKKPPIDRDKQRKLRKAAKNARKKNRKR